MTEAEFVKVVGDHATKKLVGFHWFTGLTIQRVAEAVNLTGAYALYCEKNGDAETIYSAADDVVDDMIFEQMPDTSYDGNDL